MKKLIAIALALTFVLAGCAATTPQPTQAAGNGSATPAKLGFASITMTDKSADLTEKEGKKSGLGQADTMMCAVMVDANGKVVDIKIDAVQAKITFDEAGKITSDKTAAVKSKRELGDEYGMKKASPIKKEWFEQTDAIQKWMIGKTKDEIKAMKVKTNDHGTVSDEPDLVSSATITITEFIEVAVKAIENAK